MCSNAFDVRDRVFILTGGAGLLGSRYTDALTRAGANVVVADVDGEAAERVAAAAPDGRVLPVRADVSDPASVLRLRSRALRRYGRVDGLVNNAAIDPKFDAAAAGRHESAFEEFPLEAWNRSLAVNLTGAFLCTQVLVPAMLERQGGSVVNVASIYGVVGPDQRLYDDGRGGQPQYKPPDYSVTKSALIGLTRYLAAYYAGRPVRFNALTLGGVQNGHDEGFVRRYSARVPAGRMAQPDEYAGALLFLLSDASSYMTGAQLVVDGGWTAW